MCSDKIKEKGRKWPIRTILCFSASTLIILWIIFASLHTIRLVMPEIDMVLSSQCKNPLRGWNGKVMSVPVWKNYYKKKDPRYYLTNYEHEYNPKDQNEECSTSQQTKQQFNQPIVMWGTHHKTGTFLAKKLFSKICSTLNWCCLFFVTRDSFHSMRAGICSEHVHAFGHNQWMWDPAAFNHSNYRFIHFYRHPFRKIISGYAYHLAGMEEWTKHPLIFKNVCALSANASQAQRKGRDRIESVHEFCHSTHLCEGCCRREHVWDAGREERSEVEPFLSQQTEYHLRAEQEYSFICKHLGALGESSLNSYLHESSEEEGLLAEAALDFYESLRMAHVMSWSKADGGRSLQLDLDDFAENFEQSVRRIIHHLGDLIPPAVAPALVKSLLFYDIKQSSLYRWSMTSPLTNHVTGGANKGSKKPNNSASRKTSSRAIPSKTRNRHKSNDSRTLRGNSLSPAGGTQYVSESNTAAEEKLQTVPRVVRFEKMLYESAEVMGLYSQVFELMDLPKQMQIHPS